MNLSNNVGFILISSEKAERSPVKPAKAPTRTAIFFVFKKDHDHKDGENEN